MEKAKIKMPWFVANDVGGVVYAFVGNLVNYIIVIVALKGMSWPDSLIFGRVIPGMSIGLLCGCMYYAYMAKKLSAKTGRTDITALPSGVSTPAMFVFLYGIIYPLSYSLPPEQCWHAAVAACFLGGFIEMLGGFIGPFIRKVIPRAAMLGTVAGIAMMWMATQGLFDVYHDPVLGMPVLIIALIGLIGGYVFKKRIPMLLVSVVFGMIYAAALGRVTPDFSGIGFTMPIISIDAVFQGMKIIGPYLGVIIPIEIYNFIETMDNVESAIAAGDPYNVGEAQIADGTCTMISALFGGIIPNTVWLGHAGLKKGGARIGYSWASGVLFGLCAIFGIFGLFTSLMPQVIASITFLWCAVLMLVQSFTDTPRRHGAAVALALVPHIADLVYTFVRDALGAFGTYIEPIGEVMLMDGTDEISQTLMGYGVMWQGVVALKHGAILTGIIWATFMVFVIDRRLDKAGIALVAAAALAWTGFIHAPQLGWGAAPAYAIGYLISAIVCFIFHYTQSKIMDVSRRYDYV